MLPGELNEICTQCKRFSCSITPFLPSVGPKNAELLIVLDVPGKVEDREGLFTIGFAHKLLKKLEEKVGLSKFGIRRTVAVRCGSQKDHEENKPSTQEIKLCRTFLHQEIEETAPILVLLMGAVALEGALGLKNITKRRGHLIDEGGVKYLPTFHPNAITRDPRKLKDFLEDLEQARQILEEATGQESRTSALKRRYKLIKTIEEFEEELEYLNQFPELTFDTEYAPTADWLHPDLYCLGVSFSAKEKEGCFIPIDHPQSPFFLNQYVKDRVAKILRRKGLIVHNASADIGVAERVFKVRPQDLTVSFDTMTASMAVHGPDTSHALKNFGFTIADTGGYFRELEEFKKAHNITNYSDIPLDILGVPYAAGDTDTTAQIKPYFEKCIKESKQEFFYYNILKNSYRLNMEMRRNGLLVDWDQWAKRSVYFENAMDEVYEQVTSIPEVKEFADVIFQTSKGKKKFSLRSTQQMGQLLFNVLQIEPSSRLTKGKKPSFDAKAVKEMLQGKNSPEANLVLNHLLTAAKISTYRGTFINQLAEKMWPDGRLHAEFHNFTESARRGCKSPNVQNLPDGDGEEDPFNIRMLIKARPGYKLINLDYAQLEFRLAACYSQDINMINGCIEPKPNDAHTRVAVKLNITRDCAKTVNFGIIYGAGWKKIRAEIYDQTGILLSEAKCKEIVKTMKREYPDLFRTIDETTEFVKRNGYVSTAVMGHRRLLPHAIESDDEKVRERALREGWNHKVQALGHDLLELSLIQFLDIIQKNNLPWYINNDLHDGFLAEVPDDDVVDALRISKNILENTPEKIMGSWLQVPLIAEPKYGTHFGNLKEINL